MMYNTDPMRPEIVMASGYEWRQKCPWQPPDVILHSTTLEWNPQYFVPGV